MYLKVLPATAEPVDPGFELGRHAEIVHGRADDDDVGCHELRQSCLAGGHVALEIGAFRGRCLARGREMGAGQVADRCGREIAVDDLGAGMAGKLRSDDLGGQVSANRAGAQNAGIDV